jgi:serpin B
VHQFSANKTQEMPFNALDGKLVPIPMMQMAQGASLEYMAGSGFQAVELPYTGDRISMLVIVPDEGTFADFEAGFSAEQIAAIRDGLERRSVELTFPKFTFETSFSLADTLKQMGMADAFAPGQADFSGMDGKNDLFISDVFHKAFVAVDEKGTEAAAATAVVVGVTSVMMPDVQLVVDRPFIFLILDQQSGSILFMGRFVQP